MITYTPIAEQLAPMLKIQQLRFNGICKNCKDLGVLHDLVKFVKIATPEFF
jgi:hypothetical protein